MYCKGGLINPNKKKVTVFKLIGLPVPALTNGREIGVLPGINPGC
jgi:hypothetical protein